MVFMGQQATVLCAQEASTRGRPGVLGRVELYMETTW